MLRFLLLLIFFCFGCSKSDKRVYGRWKSDVERSRHWNKAHSEMPEDELLVFSQKLGNLTVVYSQGGKCVVDMSPYTWTDGTNTHREPGYTNLATFRVIESEPDRASVYMKSDMFDCINYLNFDSPTSYWVEACVGDFSVRQYFQKAGSP